MSFNDFVSRKIWHRKVKTFQVQVVAHKREDTNEFDYLYYHPDTGKELSQSEFIAEVATREKLKYSIAERSPATLRAYTAWSHREARQNYHYRQEWLAYKAAFDERMEAERKEQEQSENVPPTTDPEADQSPEQQNTVSSLSVGQIEGADTEQEQEIDPDHLQQSARSTHTLTHTKENHQMEPETEITTEPIETVEPPEQDTFEPEPEIETPER